MNSTKNATEMMFNAPTRKRPKAAEIARPTPRLIATARMIRAEWSASHKTTSTATIETAMFKGALSLTVANWSSSIGTRPVSRTRA